MPLGVLHEVDRFSLLIMPALRLVGRVIVEEALWR